MNSSKRAACRMVEYISIIGRMFKHFPQKCTALERVGTRNIIAFGFFKKNISTLNHD
jgi:hypothetical protein